MRNNELGWPYHKRMEHIKELEGSDTAKRYDAQLLFMEQNIVLPVFRISINFPKYRLSNGRTSSLQLEWLASHPEKESDFFTGDPERNEVQEVQHELLAQLIHESSLLPYFENPDNIQQLYLILDHFGYVINGNRRLCTWRELLNKDPQRYAHFSHIDVLFLPPADPKAIDKLEGKLQVEKDIRADYSWHALANMMIHRMKFHDLDERALAEFYELSETEVKRYLEMRSYAHEYLKSRNREGKWSELEDRYAFEKLVEKRKQLKSVGEKRLFEVESFALIDNPTGGRLYQLIPDAFKYSELIKANLLNKFPIDIDEYESDNLLGSDFSDEKDIALAELIDKEENRSEALAIIKDTIETQNYLQKEESSTKYVSKMLQKANASIQSAIAGTRQPEISKDGVIESILSIEAGIATLRNWLNE